MPLPAIDVSDAFHHQFSNVICLESRLRGDNSEDVMGPDRKHWVLKHQNEVAQAQRFPSHFPTQAITSNVDARGFVTPPSAQLMTSNSGYITPWYGNFNLADQGVLDGSGSYRPPGPYTATQTLARLQTPYRPFDPAEVTAYRAAVEAQLFQSSTQSAEHQPNAPSGPDYSYSSNSFHGPNQNDPRSQLPSTPPNNQASVLRPSAPPYPPAGYPLQTPSVDSISDRVTNGSLHANTEPIIQSAGMSSLTAPDHYKPFETYALEVKVGDYIQSVMYPGEVVSHYPIEIDDQQPVSNQTSNHTLNANDNFCVQFRGTDGTIRAKVFNAVDRVYILREVAKKEKVAKKKAVKKDKVKHKNSAEGVKKETRVMKG